MSKQKPQHISVLRWNYIRFINSICSSYFYLWTALFMKNKFSSWKNKEILLTFSHRWNNRKRAVKKTVYELNRFIQNLQDPSVFSPYVVQSVYSIHRDNTAFWKNILKFSLHLSHFNSHTASSKISCCADYFLLSIYKVCSERKNLLKIFSSLANLSWKNLHSEQNVLCLCSLLNKSYIIFISTFITCYKSNRLKIWSSVRCILT